MILGARGSSLGSIGAALGAVGWSLLVSGPTPPAYVTGGQVRNVSGRSAGMSVIGRSGSATGITGRSATVSDVTD